MLASATKTKFENITNLTTANIPPRLANAVLAEVLLKIMKTIYKQIIKTTDSQNIELPKGSEILSLQTQNDDAFIWFLCNPKEQEKEVKVLDIFGTGHPITDGYDGKFIGTYQLYDGKLVFHCFERNIG